MTTVDEHIIEANHFIQSMRTFEFPHLDESCIKPKIYVFEAQMNSSKEHENFDVKYFRGNPNPDLIRHGAVIGVFTSSNICRATEAVVKEKMGAADHSGLCFDYCIPNYNEV